MQKAIHIVCCIGLFLLAGISCDEQLPPRNDPNQLFSGHLAVSYSLSVTGNYLTLRLTLTNAYDEILEGIAEIEGSVEVALLRDPSYTRVYDLDPSLIDYVPSYSPTTGEMSVPPGDSVTFLLHYNFVDGQGRDLRNAFTYDYDPTCPGRIIARRETLMVYGSAKLFERTDFAFAQPFTFEICHASTWVSGSACPPVTGPTSGCIPDSLWDAVDTVFLVPGQFVLDPNRRDLMPVPPDSRGPS